MHHAFVEHRQQRNLSNAAVYLQPVFLMALQLYLSSLFYSCTPSCVWAPSAPFAFRCPVYCRFWLCYYCPSAAHLLLVTRIRISSCSVCFRSSSLGIFRGQKILRNFLRLAVWKDASLERSCPVIRQHSEP